MSNRIVDFPDGYSSGTSPVITDPNLTAHLNDTSDAHDASAISNVPAGNLAATDVQAALNELQGDIDSLGSGAVEVAQDAIAAALAAGTQVGATLTYNDGSNLYDLTNTDRGSVAVTAHEGDTTAHPASSIVNTPAGNLAAVEVQAALNELQTDVDSRALSSALTSHTGASTAHGVSGTIVGTSDAQVLTNKDIDGGTASNTSRITIPKDTYSNLLALTRKEGTVVYATDTDKVYYDDGSTLRPVGSGSGGGINFLPLSTTWSPDNTDNVDAEISVGQWVAFADAAATTPTDLTGGSPNITIARTTTAGEILNGNASFEVTKTAANRQGEGASCLFNVPPAYQGKLCQIKMPYKVIGTIASGDVGVWIYDVTNSLLITPLANSIDQASGTLNAYFTTTPSAGTPANQQYRIGIFFASTSTNAQSIYFDDVSVGPVDSVYGPNISTPISYIPTFVGFGTVTDVKIQQRQIGGFREVWGTFNSGTVNASIASMSLPVGDVIDTNNLIANTTAAGGTGLGYYTADGVANANGRIISAPSTATNLLYFGAASTASSLFPNAGNVIAASSSIISLYALVPIASLSASTPAVILNPNIGPWNELSSAQAAAAWTGWTTVTAATARWRQVGESIEYEAKATLTTAAASEARHALPNSFTSSANYTTECVGFGASSVSTRQLAVLIESSKTYFTFGDTAGVSTTKANANAILDPGTMSFFAKVKVNGLSAAGVINAGQVAYIREEQTSGTAGGGFTSGSYVTRTLNTLTTGGTGITLASNQFVVPSGTWKIDGVAPAFYVGQHRAKLRNITASSDVLLGSSAHAGVSATDGAATVSIIKGVFTINTATTFEIQHRCNTTRATNGMGVAATFGDSEIYTQVTLTRIQ